MRTVPSQNQDDLVERVRLLAQEVAADFHSRLRVEVEVDEGKTSLETSRDEPLVDAIVQSVETVRGAPPTVGGVTYGTDAVYLGPGYGIPMVICGPGGTDMLHQPNEYVEIEQLIQGAEIYADLAQRLLG
jgi:acetylornithine deacetylase/succinyl-diaminopimelate desuccinylase-like protein